MSHASTRVQGDIRVTVAVLSREESEAVFGTSLYDDGIQPIWIEIDNRSDRNYLLVHAGIDQMAYSPLEVSYQRHAGSRESISLRNHMRLWRTRYNYRGKDIYLGQISRDVGVKFNLRTITTHAIDPDIDYTRNSLMGDLAYSQALVKIGFVKGSQRSTMDETHYNLTPDPYYSDGLRAVMFFEGRPIPLDRIRLLDWEKTLFHEIKR